MDIIFDDIDVINVNSYRCAGSKVLNKLTMPLSFRFTTLRYDNGMRNNSGKNIWGVFQLILIRNLIDSVESARIFLAVIKWCQYTVYTLRINRNM